MHGAQYIKGWNMTITTSTGNPIYINMNTLRMAIVKRCTDWIEGTDIETILYYKDGFDLTQKCASYAVNYGAFDVPYIVRCGETNRLLHRMIRNCFLGQDEWDKRKRLHEEKVDMKMEACYTNGKLTVDKKSEIIWTNGISSTTVQK